MKEDICKQFATKVQEIRQAKGFTKSKLSTLAGLDKWAHYICSALVNLDIFF